tara:strand:- start:22 stop:693 length:672 start_codon:yes stop_codon:yes gene_type:complete
MSIITIIILIKKKSNNFILGLKKQVITIFDKLSILQALIFILIFLVITAYISKYISVLSLFDFSRGYDSASLINLFSFIHTDRSPFWPHNLIPSGYPKHEQQLYMGLSFFLLVTFFYYYKKILLSENNIMLNLQIVAFTTLVFTSFLGVSIYFFLHFLPGFSGMRVGCRSILVILFPLSVLIALSIDRIIEYNKKFSSIFVLIVFLLLIEISLSKSKKQSVFD